MSIKAWQLDRLFKAVLLIRFAALIITAYVLQAAPQRFAEASPVSMLLFSLGALTGAIVWFLLLGFLSILIIDSIPRTHPRWYAPIFVFYFAVLLLSLMDLGNDLGRLMQV